MNDARSLIRLDVSTLSDSSEEKSQAWQSIVKKLDLEIKTLRELYVWNAINVKSREIKLRVD